MAPPQVLQKCCEKVAVFTQATTLLSHSAQVMWLNDFSVVKPLSPAATEGGVIDGAAVAARHRAPGRVDSGRSLAGGHETGNGKAADDEIVSNSKPHDQRHELSAI